MKVDMQPFKFLNFRIRLETGELLNANRQEQTP